MKVNRTIRAVFLIFLSVLLVLLVFLRPSDRRSPMETGLNSEAQQIIAEADIIRSSDTAQIQTAFGQIELTPPEKMPMAGYAPRSSYDSIHDPVSIRMVLFRKKDMTVCVLSSDLLLFPPFLRDYINARLPDHIHPYYTATHTHSSLGGWDPSVAGKVVVGSFQQQFWEATGDRVITRINEMSDETIPSEISYFEVAAPIVKNRLSPGSPVDSLVRGIKIVRGTTDSALMVSFSGHPTLISRKARIISADYPGALNLSRYSFTMFMAGMMGSHSITKVPGENFEKVSATADILKQRILASEFSPAGDSLAYMTYPLPLPSPQMRLSRDISVRSWVFNRAFGPLEAHLTYAAIGNIILVSTPCDYSGEIWVNDHIQVPRTFHTIITSFNGDYIGYITEDEHYDSRSHAEVRTMNWVGPGFGEYTSEVISASLRKIAR